VPVTINGVFFFRVDNVADATIKVQDFRHALAQYAQTSLRDVIGQMTLDQLLVEREAIGRSIATNVEKDILGWGLQVTGIRIQDINMPEELKKMMSRQASAEREKRATITKAEGDREASANLASAARTMAASPGAMQLRTLQTIDGLGPTASNTVVLAIPIDVMDAVRTLSRASLRPDRSAPPILQPRIESAPLANSHNSGGEAPRESFPADNEATWTVAPSEAPSEFNMQ
jgi:hypothetical protein